MPRPSNPKLYARVKAMAKRKFKVFPSAYASAWLVKEYKRRGGRYAGGGPSRSKTRRKSRSGGISRWMAEKWIDVCQLPRRVPCGRSRANAKASGRRYPYCRPTRRVSRQTPKLASQLSRAEIRRRCSRKRRSPWKRVVASRRRVYRGRKSRRRRPSTRRYRR